MNEQNEIKQTEQTAPVLTEPAAETVGEIMQKMSAAGLKWLVIVGLSLVYVAGIIYAEVHGLTLLQKGVRPDMQIWAGVGMVAAGMFALLTPVGLKVYFIEARHRLTASIFYAVDFAFLAFNAFTDFNTNAGQQLAPWAQTYATYILPASPIAIAAMVTILFSLDPDTRDKVQRLTLRMAMKEKMTREVAEAAKGANVQAVVNAAANREVERALTELFGAPVTGYVMKVDELPKRRGLLQSFFDSLFGRGRGISLPATPSQSNPSESETSNPDDQ